MTRPAPHEVPQRRDQRGVVDPAAARAHQRPDPVGQVAEEPAAAAAERVEQGAVHGVELELDGLGQQQVGGVGGGQRHPAVAPGQRAGAGPHDLARRGELVEHRGLVALDARGQHERLPGRRRHQHPGELLDHAQHAVDAAQRAREPTCCHAGRNTPERLGAAPARPRGAARRPSGGVPGAAPRRRTTRCRCRRGGTRRSPRARPRPAGRARRSRPPRRARRRPRPRRPGTGRGCAPSATRGRPPGRRTGSRNASGRPTGQRRAERVAQPRGVLDRGVRSPRRPRARRWRGARRRARSSQVGSAPAGQRRLAR